MASLGKAFTSILLAIINVKKDVVALGSQERMAIAKMCNEAVTKKTEIDNKSIEWIEDGAMGVQIVVSPDSIQVQCEEYMVSHFKLDDIKVMMSFPKSEANLVIVGQCSKKERPTALVFDLLSDQQAEQCIQAIAKAAVKENNTSSLQKTHQPSLAVQSISKPTDIGTISSSPRVALIAGQDLQPKPHYISGCNSSESVSTSSNSPSQSRWPPSHQHTIAKSMFSLNLQNGELSKLASTSSFSHPGTLKTEDPLATLEANKVEKRPLPIFLPVYGNDAHRPPLLTPITPRVSVTRKDTYKKPPESTVPPTFQRFLSLPSPRSDRQINKPSKLPKPELIFNNQQELMAKRAQILSPQSTQSILNEDTENIYENIDCTEGLLYKPRSDSSPVTVSFSGAAYLNTKSQETPNKTINYHFTEKLREKQMKSFPINHTDTPEQRVDISLGSLERNINHQLRESSSVSIGLNNPMPIDIKGKEKPQIKNPKPVFPTHKYFKSPGESPIRPPSSGLGTDKIQVGSNSNLKSVEERVRLFNGNAFKDPTTGWHGYNTLNGAPSLNALNKMLELNKAADMHLNGQHLLPTAISEGQATIDKTTSPWNISIVPKASDDSQQSDNSSEFSVDLNDEEQGNTEGESPYSLETVINRFLMNEYAYIEALERICKARKSVSPKMQNLLRGVEILFEIHVSMYTNLYASRDSCSKIAGVFISYREKLEFYKYYMLNSPDISMQFVDLPDTVKASHPLLTEDIKSSWKRIHYYYMSLEIMMSLSKEEEMSSVNESICLMKHLNMEADSGILLDCIKDTPYDLHLKAPVLLHGSFKITGPGLKSGSTFYALLFSELIVIASQKGGHYVYEMEIYIQQTNFIDTRQDNKFQLEVDRGRNKGKMNYTFKSYEGGAKKVWVEEIRKLKYTIAEKEKTERNKRFGI